MDGWLTTNCTHSVRILCMDYPNKCFKITLLEGTVVPPTKGYAYPFMNLIQGNILPRGDFNSC